MQFDLTTFVLEIINFLVLVWLLTRLFYRPIRKIIDARQLEIKKSIEEAESKLNQAANTERLLSGRLKQWDADQSDRVHQLEAELSAERAKKIAVLHTEIADLRAAAVKKLEREQVQLRHEYEARAIDQGARFSAKLLARMASPSLEKALIKAFTEDFKEMADAEKSQIIGRGAAAVYVLSAFPLDQEDKGQLVNLLQPTLGPKAVINFETDRSLIAGLSIDIGGVQFETNLKRELKFFAELERNGRP